MEKTDEHEVITLDETSTASDSSLGNNSKRKAEDDSECIVESVQERKRFCHGEETNSLTDSPIMTVAFQSEDISRKYSKDITDFISQLTKSEIATSVEKDGKPCLEFFADPEEQRDAANSQAAGNQQTDSAPQYEQMFTGVVGGRGEVKNKAETKPKNVCFNCEGDHMIAECQLPRDGARIAKNRSAHVSKNPVYSRYHEEADQRYGHLAPGSLSDGLREALGLEDLELPLHIYRMRVQGYPPGWLRSARLQRSNISVHHEPAPESAKEDGKPSEKEEEHYDLTKLISYPGFNVDCPNGFPVDPRRHAYPPMSRYWSLRAMKRRLRRAPAARRAGLQRERPADLPSSVREKPTTNGEGPEPTDAAAGTTGNGDREGSPSLETLEEQRRALLDSLETPAADGEEGELEDDEEEVEEMEEQEQVSELVHAPPAACSTPQAPVLTPGASRRRELGTPVAAASPHIVYDAEKWSAGITEHIPYENLPGATGAWDRMSSLMKKVRDHLTGKK
ncbi:zinc finger CCHC domain-containing protein 8 homolog isoform X1 [Amphibalanus amphitrite]|uniref:zinc finger CCHC domain-containing protein 8 homolog isoform X1 n=1 Tax=Amphibalanus amphitrite TaxID=1232801 RepID=UPI001C918C5B|nr:zinc finger CCHC domain-containing protein 8 homolog isoform X1 [Amphibalanus amphitrite]